MTISRATMVEAVERYFDGCNRADATLICGSLAAEAIHYFPPGMYGGPWVGAEVIAKNWERAVGTFGSYWTLDRLACDVATAEAVGEWTHFKTAADTILRGDEWYRFDPASGLILEIRAYYASPQDAGRGVLELEGYDYAGSGYALIPPRHRYPR